MNALFSSAPLPPELRRGAVIAYVSTVMAALPSGVAQLVLPKGTLRRRVAGYVWCALMTFTALVSLAIHAINPGGLSPIHLLSILTLVSVPLIICNARAGRVAQHQRAVLGLITGGLIIAGVFTLLPSRFLGQLLGRLVG